MRKKAINFAIIIIGTGLIINLSRGITRLLKAGDRVKQAEQKVTELEKKQAELQAQKDYFQSEAFLEQQARDKLNLSKEGEAVVILPENMEELVDYQKPQKEAQVPNWQQWWELFF